MEIVLDADRNQEYMERHGHEIQETESGEGSSTRVRTLREVYIPPQEIERLRELYGHVVVQDFEDEYHMSREEREKLKAQYAKFFKLRNNFTKKIRRLDKYVEACRLCLEIIWDVAKDNGIYAPEEFFKKAIKGDIIVNGVEFPSYKGKGKKSINWDYVTSFILDTSRDPKELYHNPKEDAMEEVLEESSIDDLFTQEELNRVFRDLTEEEIAERRGGIFNGEDFGDSVAGYTSKKERKAFIKMNPSYLKVIKNSQNSEDSKRRNAMIWQLDQDDMKFIREYDEKHNPQLAIKPPKFKGDVTDQDAVNAYLYQMEQYQRETNIVEYNGRYITEEEMEDIKFKTMLEENGWNLRVLYGNKERAQRMEAAKKREKKKIKELKSMLAEIQERANRREAGIDVYGEDEAGNGINKKKKKKNKKAKKKAKAFNTILLDAAGSDDAEMSDYIKRMKNMKWGD